jgi:hypothetical protein
MTRQYCPPASTGSRGDHEARIVRMRLVAPLGSGMRIERMRPSPSMSSTFSPSTGSSSNG